MSLRVTDDWYKSTVRRMWGREVAVEPKAKSAKPHKYGAKRVEIDGHSFPSLLEAKLYTNLKLQWQGGLITEPLLQVPFALGKFQTPGVSRATERYYVADFVFLEFRKSGDVLVIADAKGHYTTEYSQKKKLIWELYRICIREYRRRDL